MPAYIYRSCHRHTGETLGPTLDRQIVKVSNPHAVIAQARTINLDTEALGATAIYVAAS